MAASSGLFCTHGIHDYTPRLHLVSQSQPRVCRGRGGQRHVGQLRGDRQHRRHVPVPESPRRPAVEEDGANVWMLLEEAGEVVDDDGLGGDRRVKAPLPLGRPENVPQRDPCLKQNALPRGIVQPGDCAKSFSTMRQKALRGWA